jgi:hypothetical protein
MGIVIGHFLGYLGYLMGYFMIYNLQCDFMLPAVQKSPGLFEKPIWGASSDHLKTIPQAMERKYDEAMRFTGWWLVVVDLPL